MRTDAHAHSLFLRSQLVTTPGATGLLRLSHERARVSHATSEAEHIIRVATHARSSFEVCVNATKELRQGALFEMASGWSVSYCLCVERGLSCVLAHNLCLSVLLKGWECLFSPSSEKARFVREQGSSVC